MALIVREKERTMKDCGIEFRIVGAADSRGAAVSADGIGPEQIIAAKDSGQSVAAIPNAGIPGMTVQKMILHCNADIYVEATPANLPSGEPGLSNILTALTRKMHVVSANKVPLALHWAEIFHLASEKGLMIRYGTAASAGLPVLEMGRMLGSCGELLEFTGIFNAACMYMIDSMNLG